MYLFINVGTAVVRSVMISIDQFLFQHDVKSKAQLHYGNRTRVSDFKKTVPMLIALNFSMEVDAPVLSARWAARRYAVLL